MSGATNFVSLVERAESAFACVRFLYCSNPCTTFKKQCMDDEFQMKGKNNISVLVGLIGIVVVYYYLFVAPFSPPTFERYVDLKVLPKEEIMAGVKFVVLFHAERDAKFSKEKIGGYSLRVLDGVPSEAYINNINRHDIPRVDRRNINLWDRENGRMVKIHITKIILLNEKRIKIESEFQYAPKRKFSNSFTLEKRDYEWEIADFSGSTNDYLNISNFKKKI